MQTRSNFVAIPRLFAGTAGLLLFAGPSLSGPCFAAVQTATPIEHLVVIFQENISFDHYFATYPVALNPPDEPFFQANDDTPSVNGQALWSKVNRKVCC